MLSPVREHSISGRGCWAALPGEASAESGVLPADGSARSAEGVRFLTVLKNDGAPTEYSYSLSLPEGAELAEASDGSVLVRDAEGELLANIDPAWAKDADGRPVPTSYRVEGTTLVQTIRPPAGTRYPVVADPFWIPVILLLARIIIAQGIKSYSRHALGRMAQRGISRQMVENAVKYGRRSSGGTSDTVKFTHGKIWVIVNKSGNVVSVGWK